MLFKDSTVVVAGAGGGMGKEIVETLLAEGANVVGCDMNVDKLDNHHNQSNFLSIKANLLEENAVEKAFLKAVEKFDTITGLVNAAGIAQSSTPIEDVSLESWHKTIDINMTMTFLMCREAVKYMKKEQQGSIVNIGSVATTRPRPGLQAYVASKGAVESFTKALALELASFKINANVLHPGPCDTDMLEQFAADGANIEEVKEDIFRQSVPLGNLLTPGDIANSVSFLLSKEAKMITGSVLHVDGGRGI
ncbi:3-oxoacyl-[acyl-carrier protein] reductase [Salinibacillus kushneri]|uniref:3-oxoacyl-[acyl-carrier protein] reductase n=1 Tax=Salinibacillus kushneri TaxID=237682 RepID=A0A1H9ZCB6_9BACI|nr:SDR family oxidoreductase [Salinibacillus kushneri]SES79118.1 3-oxoacyl-[acyl-carrier protein] reductase [Salinibacillus kushneri]